MSLINRIPESPLTRLAVKNQGKWVFILVPQSNFVLETDTARVFNSSVEFGLVAAKQTNPAKISRYGSISDMLVVRNNGTLDIISNKEFTRRYTKSATPTVTQPITIRSSAGVKKLEEQAQKQVPLRSNTVAAPRANKVERPPYNPQDERGSRY
jgi:hypothetical protein